ncbi:hypothetical protein ACFXTH_044454 [Malus domestica]
MLGKASLKDFGACCMLTHTEDKQQETRKTTKEGLKGKMDAEKFKKTKNAPKPMVKDQVLAPEYNLRST